MTENNTEETHQVGFIRPMSQDNDFSYVETETLPKRYRDELDDMAVGFYDTSRLAVVADEASVAEFLVNQFVGDFDRYSKRLDEEAKTEFFFMNSETLGLVANAHMVIQESDDSEENSSDVKDSSEEDLSHDSHEDEEPEESLDHDSDTDDRHCKVVNNIKGILGKLKKNTSDREVSSDDEDEDFSTLFGDTSPIEWNDLTTSDEDKILEGVSNLYLILEKAFDLTSDQVCIVTDSPGVVAIVGTIKPESKIIFFGEKIEIFSVLEDLDEKWAIFDADIPLDKEFVHGYLDYITEDYVQKIYHHDITSDEISKIIDILETKVGRENFSILPPSILVATVKRLVGLYVMTHNEDLYENNAPSFEKVADYFADHKITTDIVNLKPIEYKKAAELRAILKDHIVAQDDAIDRVVGEIRLSASGLKDPSKPLASAMLAGTTGVGKTEIAKLIAKHAATEEMSFLSLDMAEYQEPHKISTLFGAPPGYAGFEKGGVLTNFVKENPTSVILFDEIEKAHNSFYTVAMGILDEGRATSSTGEIVDFSKCIVFFTTNKGAYESNKNKLGFNTSSLNEADTKKSRNDAFMGALREEFPLEFLNRMDDLIVFDSLSKESGIAIARKEVEVISNRINLHSDITIDYIDDEILQMVVSQSAIEKNGAREIKRIVTSMIGHPLSEYIDERTNKESHAVSISLDGNKDIVVTESSRAK